MVVTLDVSSVCDNLSSLGRKRQITVYEIDFLPVGDGERGGDAIAMRFGPQLTPQQQQVVVIDGGTKESGEALVSHIRTFYGTSDVNLVVCTHSDSDHACGLLEVLENLTVHNLAMHRPSNHAASIDELFRDPRINEDNLKRRFKESLDNAHQLEQLANKKRIPIVEPFSDTTNGTSPLSVLGPSKKFYEQMLLSFRGAPEPAAKSIFSPRFVSAVKEAVKWVMENWGIETLAEPDANASSAENNSSAILLFKDKRNVPVYFGCWRSRSHWCSRGCGQNRRQFEDRKRLAGASSWKQKQCRACDLERNRRAKEGRRAIHQDRDCLCAEGRRTTASVEESRQCIHAKRGDGVLHSREDFVASQPGCGPSVAERQPARFF